MWCMGVVLHVVHGCGLACGAWVWSSMWYMGVVCTSRKKSPKKCMKCGERRAREIGIQIVADKGCS